MSMESFPKKEIVVISAAAVASGIGAVALYILKHRGDRTIFVEGIDEETAKLYGVVRTDGNNERLDKLNPERYDGEPTNEEQPK